ncbi:MAG: CocE/NonD family hydrolase, partial [Candidatus Acidiferrum sp.]
MRRMKWISVAFLLVVTFAVSTSAQEEQSSSRPNLPELFEKKEVMIPMRDGVKLHTEIYTPRSSQGALPIFIERSPYGVADAGKGHSSLLYRYSEMFADGYIFAFQDIRGRYGSQGKFEMNRPVHDPSDAKGIDESTD